MNIWISWVLLAIFLVAVFGIFASLFRMRRIKQERIHCPNCEMLVSQKLRGQLERCPSCGDELAPV